MPAMITANRLADGEVVYLTANGGWSPQLTEGYAFEGQDEEDRMLSIAAQAEAELVIVASYVMEAAWVDGHLAPISQRERIRAQGPTVETERRRRASASNAERV